MLYHLSLWLSHTAPFFVIFQSIIFRLIMGLFTGLGFSLYGGAWFIKQSARFRSRVREYTPQTHQAKNDTPTMGGIFVLIAAILSALLWCDLSRPEVWIFLACLVGFGAIGFWDDYMKIRYKKGIKESHKFGAQVVVGLLVTLLWYWLVAPSTEICIPFMPSFKLYLGLFLIPWATFILIGASNAVNFTDGLDGLAIGSLIVNYGTFSLVCFLAGSAVLAQQFAIPYTQTSEIAILGVFS